LSGVTWLGHSTVVLDLDGTRVITDPVLRRRVFHLRREAAVADELVAALDGILVSHTHFDHLDFPSLRRLDRAATVAAPHGAGTLVRRRGFRHVVELGAGDTLELGSITVRATHADHESSRGPFSGRTASLGYLLEGSATVYFAGDTDIFDGMRELGPVDVALIPIWGWGPKLGPGHLDPKGAAEVLTLVRPRIVVPIHWGTFSTPFAKRPDDSRAREFIRFAHELAPEVEVRVLRHGETLALEAVR
jgi:L-ascorbate metabolism protein UlaG (beta-lactamase superfamily)